MMTNLRDILSAELSAAGLNVKAAPAAEPLHRVASPVCALRLAEASIMDAAMGRYLGTISDPEEGEIPLFGRAFLAEVEILAYAPDPNGCDGLSGAALDALLTLPGLNITAFSVAETRWDDDAAAFARPVRARIGGILYCEMSEESGEFTDFRLVPTVN